MNNYKAAIGIKEAWKYAGSKPAGTANASTITYCQYNNIISQSRAYAQKGRAK